VSWPGAMRAGAGGWSTDGCDWMAGASITSVCNGSGVRKGSSDLCRVGGSAPVQPEASRNCCEPNTRTMCGLSTSSSTKRWMAGR
jgi:hypothetical protein